MFEPYIKVENDLTKEYYRLLGKVSNSIEKNIYAKTISLSNYAYETLKLGNAIRTDKLEEYNVIMGLHVVDKDLKGEELEVHGTKGNIT